MVNIKRLMCLGKDQYSRNRTRLEEVILAVWGKDVIPIGECNNSTFCQAGQRPVYRHHVQNRLTIVDIV